MDLKKLASVTDAVEKIMAEALKGDQHKIDKNKNNKIDAHDFKLLRKEDAEQLDEYESKNGTYRHQGTYGYAGKGAEHGSTDFEKANDDEKKEAKSNRRKYGARQNYVRSKRVNEFTDLLSTYKDGGLKSLAEAWAKKKKVMTEEPSNEEFTKEVEEQQAKMDGKKKGGDVAKPAVQAVQNEETVDIEVVIDEPNGFAVETIEERTLTASETEKKEDIVKGMKKGVAGFKDRYGKDAKSVMYATATKLAKEDVETIEELNKSTLVSYRTKSIGRASDFEKKGYAAAKGGAGNDKSDKLFNKADSVTAARQSAKNKILKKEEVEPVVEARDNTKYLENMKHPDYNKHYEAGEKHMKEPMGDESYVDNARMRKKEELKKNPHKKGTMEHQAWHHGASNEADYHIDSLK